MPMTSPSSSPSTWAADFRRRSSSHARFVVMRPQQQQSTAAAAGPVKRKTSLLANMLNHQDQQKVCGFLSLQRSSTSGNSGGKFKLLRHSTTSAPGVHHLMSSADVMQAAASVDATTTIMATETASSSSSSSAKGAAAAAANVPTSATGRSAGGGGSRSVSLASVSSDGSSNESHLMVEQEDIVALTQEVRAFKEALGRLRRLFHPPQAANHVKGNETVVLRVAAHERLGEVLRILRVILERYPALQSTELLVAAGSLIQQVKEHPYEDDKSDTREFMESIDQLALAFSSRVSEYLMGDLDSNVSLASSASSKTKSCENLPSDAENGISGGADSLANKSMMAATDGVGGGGSDQLSGQQMDAVLLQLEQGVEVALHRAKLWSKYAKDIMTYVEKRCNLEVEFAKQVAKLAQTMRSALKEECYLPFQSIYITAMDREMENSTSAQTTTALLAGHKFLEPLSARRNEHERCRKQIKETWHRELKRMQESVSNLRKAKALYVQRQQEWERAKEAALKAECAAEASSSSSLASYNPAGNDYHQSSSSSNQQQQQQHQLQHSSSTVGLLSSSLSTSSILLAASGGSSSSKVDKRKRTEEDALQKAMEAEIAYKASVSEANERHSQLLRVKSQVLQQVRELMLQCDQTMKAVTVSYFQLQHTVSAPAPVQFQTLCESSRLYEPGSQYMEFIRKMPLPSKQSRDGTPVASLPSQSQGQAPYTFEPYSEESTSVMDKDRKSNGSLSADSNESTGKERSQSGVGIGGPMKAWSASGVGSSGGSSSGAGPSSGGGSGVGGSAAGVTQQISSDTESVESSPSAKSRETSPTASPMMPARRLVPASSGDELENEPDPEVDAAFMGYNASRRHCMSKAAVTHTFRKLKTPSRCRECDSYVYFQGAECIECGLGCHKKCLESLTIQCGHKRLPRKMTTFGVDLSQHLAETGTHIPHLLAKCISEIDSRGMQIKGLYRVSGVKSKVEKLCQSFENGADLVDLTDIHPNVIANVLKLYLRQLPEALLTSRLYPDFIRVARDWSGDTGVDDLRELVHKLPRHHYATLAFLMHHLKRVATEQETNNMPASNLGIVFGPTLLRTSEGSATLSSLVDTVHQTRVIELLIEHAESVFGPPESTAAVVAASAAAAAVSAHPRSPAAAIAIANKETLEAQSLLAVASSSSSSLLSKVPVVRSISFLEKHRSKSRDNDPGIVSTPADRRLLGLELREEVLLPGFVADSVKTPNSSLDIADPSSEDGLLSPASDEDLPDFLLPDDSSKTRKLPGYLRTGSAPKIFKSSLKDYHGLEGVNLCLLSSQDHEVAPVSPATRSKKSITDPSTVQPSAGAGSSSGPQLLLTEPVATSEMQGGSHPSLIPTVKTSLNPFMDSSIDSDHSWESHSTGSSGRGTQHSDQGSLGSVQRALASIQPDETDGRVEMFVSLTSHHRVSHDENRVKIQVPSASLPVSWNTSSGPSGSTQTESSSSTPRGIVTILEGPQSCTTLVESLANEPTKTSVGGGGGVVRRSGGTNLVTGAHVISDLATVIPVGITHDSIAHVFGRSSGRRERETVATASSTTTSVASTAIITTTTTTTTTMTSAISLTAGSDVESPAVGLKKSSNASAAAASERAPRFV